MLPQNILSGLSDGDYGAAESSNAKINYRLQELAIDRQHFRTLLAEKQIGKPYKWAQQLCGLDFAAGAAATSQSHELAQMSVPSIVKQIRSRWQTRLALYTVISTLGLRGFFFFCESSFKFNCFRKATY